MCLSSLATASTNTSENFSFLFSVYWFDSVTINIKYPFVVLRAVFWVLEGRWLHLLSNIVIHLIRTSDKFVIVSPNICN